MSHLVGKPQLSDVLSREISFRKMTMLNNCSQIVRLPQARSCAQNYARTFASFFIPRKQQYSKALFLSYG